MENNESLLRILEALLEGCVGFDHGTLGEIGWQRQGSRERRVDRCKYPDTNSYNFLLSGDTKLSPNPMPLDLFY